jgi:hypothetical protein
MACGIADDLGSVDLEDNLDLFELDSLGPS